MALNPTTSFPGQIAAPSAGYPFGEARDITIPGDNEGTPWRADLINDIFGFQQALLKEPDTPLVPSGSPDEVGTSQYLDALKLIAARAAVELIYPVGSLYTSALATNPGTILGFGTWVVFGAGRVMVGIDSGDTDFDVGEETGGSKVTSKDAWGSTQDTGKLPSPTTDERLITGSGLAEAVEQFESLAEAANDQSNLQPYVVVYMWKRTA